MGVSIMESAPHAINMIPLTNLIFDPDNPRLPKEFRGNRDEAPVIKHMLRDEIHWPDRVFCF